MTHQLKIAQILSTLDRIQALAKQVHASGRPAPPELNSIALDIVETSRILLSESRYTECLRITSQLKALRLSVHDLDLLRAQSFLGLSQIESAREALKEELRYFPDNAKAWRLLNELAAPATPPEAGLPPEFSRLLDQVRPYTMLSTARLRSLYELAVLACHEDQPGNFVECGVAAGGSSALLAWVIKMYSKRPRRLYCFDTFGEMPSPTVADSHANTAANDTGWGIGTCAAPMQSLIDICKDLGVSDIIEPIKGLFKDTLPQKSSEIRDIAILHVDGDWYESIRDILANLYDHVVPNGFVQVDDYGHWDGCKKALHEYESKFFIKFDLQHIDNTGVWFRKLDRTVTSQLLNLGCGQRHHSAWTNIDFKSNNPEVTAHDLTQGIPVQSGSIDVVYHSHLLEHFPKERAPAFLHDCYRVLKPGGIIRVVAPDLENIARLYLDLLDKSLKGDEEAQKRYDWIMLELFDQMVRNHPGGEMLKYWQQNPMPAEDFVIERLGSEVKDALGRIRSKPGARNQPVEQPNSALEPHKLGQFRLSGEIHQWMYDQYSLAKLLKETGFEDIKVCQADESRIPDFNRYLLDIEADGSVRKPDSLFVEGQKPEEHDSKMRYAEDLHQTRPVIAQLCMQDFGGAGTAALRLHEGLRGLGASNTLYVQNMVKWRPGSSLLNRAPHSTSNQNFISLEWQTFQAKNKEALTKYPLRPHGLELFSIPWAATKLKENPEIANADIINLHWISGTVSIPDNLDFLKGKKIVWTLHDMNALTGGCHYSASCQKYEHKCGSCPQLGSSQDNDLSRQIWNSKMAAYRQLDITIIALSQWMANCVKNSSLLSSFPVHSIPNGVPTDVFKPYPQAKVREALRIPHDAFVILFGADSVTNTRKGFVHLMRALEHLRMIAPDKHVALVTFGHNAQNAVRHLGLPTFPFDYIENESELALIYSLADVTVIPSLEDNLPNVVLESMACGTPVVGFKIGGIPDMIEHQVNGYLALPGNHKELAEGMLWIMNQKEKKSMIRLKCRETTLTRYNISLQAKRYRELYKTIFDKQKQLAD